MQDLKFTVHIEVQWAKICFLCFLFFFFIYFFFIFYYFFFKFYFIFKLYITVLDLPDIKMNPPQVYMCSPS